MSSLCQYVEHKWNKNLFYKMKVLNQLFTIIIIYLFILILIRAINISQTDVCGNKIYYEHNKLVNYLAIGE